MFSACAFPIIYLSIQKHKRFLFRLFIQGANGRHHWPSTEARLSISNETNANFPITPPTATCLWFAERGNSFSWLTAWKKALILAFSLFQIRCVLYLSEGAIIKCAAGGRDHTNCCIRRAVPAHCLHFCRAVLSVAPVDCFTSHGSSIIQCYDEGNVNMALSTREQEKIRKINERIKNNCNINNGRSISLAISLVSRLECCLITGSWNIPDPIENLRAAFVSNASVTLEWTSRSSSQQKFHDIDFVVKYAEIDIFPLNDTSIKLNHVCAENLFQFVPILLVAIAFNFI